MTGMRKRFNLENMGGGKGMRGFGQLPPPPPHTLFVFAGPGYLGQVGPGAGDGVDPFLSLDTPPRPPFDAPPLDPPPSLGCWVLGMAQRGGGGPPSGRATFLCHLAGGGGGPPQSQKGVPFLEKWHA